MTGVNMKLLFETTVPAKWVLSGEHAVLRGGRAITFPHPQFQMNLKIIQGNPSLAMSPEIQSLIFKAGQLLKIPTSFLNELSVEMQSTIPVGAGLGSSAAICVALARGMMSIAGNPQAMSQPDACISLATHLEDTFHGKSSGMDIHAIAWARPLLFSIQEGARPLALPASTSERFQFVDTGLRGRTRECISLVNAIEAERRQQIDLKMSSATEAALAALESQFEVAALAQAMNQAQACFEAWGLVPPALLEQKTKLLNQGALAVKLTGAGLGGFWVVLWPESGPRT